MTRSDGVVKEPIWKFIKPMPEQFLTSLVYCRNLPLPPVDGTIFFDCGAWSYKTLSRPKWDPEECARLYSQYACRGDLVAAPDHMVIKKHSDQEEDYRVRLTLEYANEFIKLVPQGVIPVGVTHGNSVRVRLKMAEAMLGMGYRYLALGGLAGRAASDKKFIHAVIEAFTRLREEYAFNLHVLGISAIRWVREFKQYGSIDSFDGSTMFLRAFRGSEYYWLDPGNSGYIKKYVVKDLKKEQIPLCNCPPCSAMRAEGKDTRQMGSNEHNMGRAVHNINVYLQALELMLHEKRIV